MESLKYLGHLLTLTDDDWPPYIFNLQKARKICSRMSRILGWEDTDDRTPGCFYIAIVQAILIFGTETWVVTPDIGQLLGVFHHRLVRWILGKQSLRWEEGNWE